MAGRADAKQIGVKLLLRRLRFGIENVALGVLYLWPVKHWRRRIEATVRTKLDVEFHAWRKTQSDRCEISRAHTLGPRKAGRGA